MSALQPLQVGAREGEGIPLYHEASVHIPLARMQSTWQQLAATGTG